MSKAKRGWPVLVTLWSVCCLVGPRGWLAAVRSLAARSLGSPILPIGNWRGARTKVTGLRRARIGNANLLRDSAFLPPNLQRRKPLNYHKDRGDNHRCTADRHTRFDLAVFRNATMVCGYNINERDALLACRKRGRCINMATPNRRVKSRLNRMK